MNSTTRLFLKCVLMTVLIGPLLGFLSTYGLVPFSSSVAPLWQMLSSYLFMIAIGYLAAWRVAGLAGVLMGLIAVAAFRSPARIVFAKINTPLQLVLGGLIGAVCGVAAASALILLRDLDFPSNPELMHASLWAGALCGALCSRFLAREITAA